MASTLILNTSGCVTGSLFNDIAITENQRRPHHDDSITAAAITKNEKDEYKWVFVGNKFDYTLQKGADGLMRALASGEIDKTRIQASSKGSFMLGNARNRFHGYITLTYTYQNHEDREMFIRAVNISDARCSDTAGASGNCQISLGGLEGTIHRKSKVPDDVFRFNTPIEIGFYTEKTLSAKRVLYPAAIAADVALIPIYLLGIGLFLYCFENLSSSTTKC